MSRFLIVHAHPEPQSFTAAMKDQAVELLTAAGHEVKVSDLYAKGFNPVASKADFKEPANPGYLVYALEQRHGFASKTLAPDILAEVELLQWADVLILSFPVFWFSTPAILKGWIDRVFLSGPCYGGRRIYDRGGMAGKRAMIQITLGGREHMFGENAIHGDMATLLRPIQQGALAYVGYQVLPPFIGYHIPYLKADDRAAILDQHRNHLLTLDDRPALSFPSMTDFDEQMMPVVRPLTAV